MWDKVASIAGKGVGFAGERLSKAVEAASYVGEVIAPVVEDADDAEVSHGEKLAWGAPAHEAAAQGSIVADVGRQGSEGEEVAGQEGDLNVLDASAVNGSGGQGHDDDDDDRPPSDAFSWPDGGEAPGHEAWEGQERFASGMGVGMGMTSSGENDVEVPWPETDTMDQSPKVAEGDAAPAERGMFTEVELGPEVEENGARAVWDGNGSLDMGGFSGARGSEVRILADTVASLEQEVADLRSSVEAAERRAREAEDRSRGLEQLSEGLRRTVDSAHAELLQGSEFVAEGREGLSSSEANGLVLDELARSVAACLRDTAVRHNLWRARLEQLVAATDPRRGESPPEVNGSETAGVSERVNDLLTVLEEEASTSRDSKSSAALQERSLEVERLGEELSRQKRTNEQLKLVIDQMRDISRTNGNEVAILRDQLEAMAKAKASADTRANDAEELLERAKRTAQAFNVSDEEKDRLVSQLKQAHQEAEDARATIRMIQVASGEELESCRALHDEVLQREQHLRSQLKVLTTDLSLAHQDRERHESALEHLRGVLEAFQSENQTEVHSMEAKHRRDMELLEKEHEAARAELKRSHDAKLSESKRKADAMMLAERRGLALREGDNIRLRDELHRSRAAMDVALLQLQSKQDDALDRRLVTNLIVRYVTSREKRQVLELAAKILNFSEEEMELVGLKRRGPSLPDLLTSVFTASSDDRAKRDTGEGSEGTSLSEMWMDFLMTESDNASSGGTPK